MYEYEIEYRLGEKEYFCTSATTIKADSVEGIFNEIRSIEKRNTIISIKNLSMGIE